MISISTLAVVPMSMVISSSQITGTNHGMHAIWPFPSGATLLSTLLHALTMKGKRKGSSCNLPTEVCTRVSLLLLLLCCCCWLSISSVCCGVKEAIGQSYGRNHRIKASLVSWTPYAVGTQYLFTHDPISLCLEPVSKEEGRARVI